MTRVVIEAVCLDDKGVPHPASQVFPDRDVEATYEGELYRCIAGTRMQYTWAEFDGHVAFDHGTTVSCEKGLFTFATTNNTGRVTRVRGSVIDVAFDGVLPRVWNLLEIKADRAWFLTSRRRQRTGPDAGHIHRLRLKSGECRGGNQEGDEKNNSLSHGHYLLHPSRYAGADRWFTGRGYRALTPLTMTAFVV